MIGWLVVSPALVPCRNIPQSEVTMSTGVNSFIALVKFTGLLSGKTEPVYGTSQWWVYASFLRSASKLAISTGRDKVIANNLEEFFVS